MLTSVVNSSMRYLEIPKGVLLLIARLISQFSMVISTSLVINNAGTSIFAQMTVIWALASFFSFADFGLANGIVNLLTTEDPISQERHIRRTLALLVSLSVLLIAVISSPIGSFAIRQLSFSANKEWSSEFDLALKFGVISAILYNFYVLLVRILQSRSKEISLSVLMICLSISNVLYTYIVSSTNSPLTYLSFANYGVLGIAAICILVARSLHIVFSFRNFIETFREAHLYLGTGKIFLLIHR